MARVGIFGGSFNPPHLGHLLAAKELLRELKLDRVDWIPTNVPPHKAMADGSPTGRQRLEMVQALIADEKAMCALELELQRGGASYTAMTLRQLSEQNPEDTLYFLMGTDMFLSFHTWREPEVICRLATLVLALREEPDFQELAAIWQQKAVLEEWFGAKIVMLQNRIFEVSSTLIRRMLAFDCAQDYLAPEVLTYIKTNKLYGTELTRRGLDFNELKAQSLALHKPSRVAHVIGCSETAEKLAHRWGADPVAAARAGILHDITKALDGPAHLKLCDHYHMPLTDFEHRHDKLLHAKSGAAVARDVFGEPEAVWRAIFWHTTGKGDMSLLEKIIYLADYMEPNRDFDGVEELRALSETDLDRAILRAFEMSLDMLEQRGKSIDPYSREAYEWLHEHMNATGGSCDAG